MIFNRIKKHHCALILPVILMFKSTTVQAEKHIQINDCQQFVNDAKQFSAHGLSKTNNLIAPVLNSDNQRLYGKELAQYTITALMRGFDIRPQSALLMMNNLCRVQLR